MRFGDVRPPLIRSILLLFGFAAHTVCQAAPVPTEHVIVMVWDGLRPDSVDALDTPTLFKMSQEGTTFAHHHPVYLSSTEVNGTALATGSFPLHDGVIANHEYRPEIELLKPIGTESAKAVKKGDELTGGKYLAHAHDRRDVAAGGASNGGGGDQAGRFAARS